METDNNFSISNSSQKKKQKIYKRKHWKNNASQKDEDFVRFKKWRN